MTPPCLKTYCRAFVAEGIEPRQTATGTSYKARVYDARAGKRVSKTFGTLAEARRWRAAKLDEAARGIGVVGPSDRSETSRRSSSAGAARRHGANAQRHALPPERRARIRAIATAAHPADLGGAPIGRLQRRDLQRLADEMLGAGADASTIRNALKPVQAIYRRLIEDGDLAINPCAELRLPSARGRRERIATPEEARALIAATRAGHRALWGWRFDAGLRRGELRALRWDAVDFAAGLIRVESSMNSYGELTDPKSRAGRRAVPIVAALGALLADHRVLTNHVDGYVFGSTPLTPFTPSNIRQIGEHGLAPCRAPADRPARVPAHLREHPDRRRRERPSDYGLHGSREHPDHIRSVRAPHARQRARGGHPHRRLPRSRRDRLTTPRHAGGPPSTCLFPDVRPYAEIGLHEDP